ncbi:MAG: hypothetical protein R3C03_18740 [Pirellulaceae bacterium]
MTDRRPSHPLQTAVLTQSLTGKQSLAIRLICGGTFFLLVACMAVAAFGQDETQQRSQLGERQRFVERKMAELESKFTTIAQQISEKEPERAERLVKAYQLAKEKLLTERMARVSQLMDQGRFVDAQKGLDEVIGSLDELVKLLIDQKDPEADKQREIEQLEEWKKEIQQLQREQQKQTKETDNAANKEDAIKRLEAQIKELNELIEKQKDVIRETEDSEGKGLKTMDRVADKQFELRKQTENLTDRIGKGENADDSAAENQDGTSKPSDNSSGSGEAQGKPSDKNDDKSDKQGNNKGDEENPDDAKNKQPGDENKSGDEKTDQPKSDKNNSKPSDSKNPSGDKPSDSKSGDSKQGTNPGKPGEKQSDSSNSSQSKPGSENPSGNEQNKQQQNQQNQEQNQQPQPGEQPLQKASDFQRRAEEKLASGKSEDAKRQQEQAIDEMEKAKLELEKEKRRIASLPPDALERLAQEQRRLRDKAMDVAKQMKEAPKPSNQDKQGEQGASQQQQQPGQDSMQQAGDSMQKAAGEMEEQDNEQAQREQKEAERKLQKALEEIEERLSQLREETREEKLKRLEARFNEMFERQKVASLMTRELDDKTNALGSLERRDELVLLRLATEEAEIRELGQQAYDLLLEDGTSSVFPEVVQNLHDDLMRASELLSQKRTDKLTQLVQREIESALKELLEALKRRRRNPKVAAAVAAGAVVINRSSTNRPN